MKQKLLAAHRSSNIAIFLLITGSMNTVHLVRVEDLIELKLVMGRKNVEFISISRMFRHSFYLDLINLL
jgi:hypothetical protein